MAQIEFLGTGISTGVPQPLCNCDVCRSTDPRDKRLRCSSILKFDNTYILIDCSPDFRYQAMRAGIDHIDALLLTHAHTDHMGGLDDLRPYCTYDPMPIYAEERVLNDVRTRLPYCFMQNPYPGIPRFDTHIIAPSQPFKVGNIDITPLRVMHYNLPIVGYRMGNMAYITDCLTMPDETVEQLKGLDLLIINALRKTEHISHQTLDMALSVIERLAPRQAYLIHMSHDMGFHAEESKHLPHNVHFAYDGLTLDF